MKELLKAHLVKRLPAIITAVLLTAVLGLYYVGAYDVSFIERPESWRDNFSHLGEVFSREKTPPEEKLPEKETEAVTEPAETEPAKPKKKKKKDKQSKAQDITFKTVSELKKEGYSLTDKVWDSSCVLGELTCDYRWPSAYSYSKKTYDKEKFTYYDDGTETKREVVRETAERPALETYMGYILYDDMGSLYLVGPDGAVMTRYDDSSYIPAYTRDLEGRPLFYRTYTTTVKYPTELGKEDKEGNKEWLKTKEMQVECKKYYYLSESGQYFVESDYNDVTDNRGLYFDYPAYYGNTDTDLMRYYFNSSAVVTDLKNETKFVPRMSWMYSREKVKLEELEFDKDGKNKKDEKGKPFEEMFPYTMAYNYRGNYAAVKMDIKWEYDHEVNDGKGGKKNENVKVTSNELRVVDKTGHVMFSSRKNYFSELGWTANERFVDPLSLGIDSIGSYYFDHGLMRMRIQSYDRYYFTDLDMVFIVTDDDVLVRPDGTKFNIPSGYTLKAYNEGILLLEKDGLYGYLTYDGTWIREAQYSDAKTFMEGLAVVCSKDGKYGVIDNTGKILVPYEYDSITTVSSGTMAAYSAEKGWTVFQKLSK